MVCFNEQLPRARSARVGGKTTISSATDDGDDDAVEMLLLRLNFLINWPVKYLDTLYLTRAHDLQQLHHVVTVNHPTHTSNPVPQLARTTDQLLVVAFFSPNSSPLTQQLYRYADESLLWPVSRPMFVPARHVLSSSRETTTKQTAELRTACAYVGLLGLCGCSRVWWWRGRVYGKQRNRDGTKKIIECYRATAAAARATKRCGGRSVGLSVGFSVVRLQIGIVACGTKEGRKVRVCYHTPLPPCVLL